MLRNATVTESARGIPSERDAPTPTPHRRTVLERAWSRSRRLVRHRLEEFRDRWQGTTLGDDPAGRLHPIEPAVALTVPTSVTSEWRQRAERALSHEFNLLGSGWVRVAYGVTCAGLEGFRYDSGPAVKPDANGEWLRGRINPSNLETSQAVWRLVEPGYEPIDWQLDFRSGYRWSERQWSGFVPFGHRPGVDVKLPWELARMQHWPPLALLTAIDANAAPGLQREFRNQALDFIATNPPRYGVNWRCPMDVAIRAANWLLAFDLFHAVAVRWDAEFLNVFTRSVWEHGWHIVQHLEWTPQHRGNHYLADIAGLAFIAAHLPSTPDTDAWLAFCRQELIGEVKHQFLPDGGNFEASVCYHRLSAEMVIYATALLLGLPPERCQAFAADHRHGWRRMPALRSPDVAPGVVSSPPAAWMFPAWYVDRLQRMADFTAAVTKPNGLVHQLGDNDSGRFVHLQRESMSSLGETASECFKPRETSAGDFAITSKHDVLKSTSLDHTHLTSAFAGLLESATATTGLDCWLADRAVVQWLANGQRWTRDDESCAKSCHVNDHSEMEWEALRVELADEARWNVVESRIPFPRALQADLATHAFPDFGLYIWRGSRGYVAVRCGRLSPGALGGHAHHDQLAVEIHRDGVDLWRDPGTYVYTALPSARNRYRSLTAHSGPLPVNVREPAPLNQGLFHLKDRCQATCLHFSRHRFVGRHHGFATPVVREIVWDAEALAIRDYSSPQLPLQLPGAAAAASELPFSPGYGELWSERRHAG